MRPGRTRWRITPDNKVVGALRDAIGVEDSTVDLNAQARPVGYIDKGVVVLDRYWSELVADRVFFLLEFQHQRYRLQARRLVPTVFVLKLAIPPSGQERTLLAGPADVEN